MLKSRSGKGALKTIGIIALCVIVIGIAAEAYLVTRSSIHVPPKGTRIELTSTGVPHWYEVASGRSLVRVAEKGTLPNGGMHYLESAPSAVSGELAILAQDPVSKDFVFGITHSDGTFTALVSDKRPKSDLATSGTYAAFVQAPSETSIEELLLMDMETKKVTNLGRARSPRFLSDGSLLALGQEGLILIDPRTYERTVLVSRTGADSIGSAISPDGASVIFYDLLQKTILLYARDSQDQTRYAFRGAVPDIDIVDGGFVSRDQFLTISRRGDASIWAVPATLSEGIQIQARLSVM